MKTLFNWTGLAFVMAVIPVHATIPIQPPPNAVNVEENELQEVIRLLRNSYADPTAIKDRQINQSAINGVIHQLGAGAVIMSGPSADTTNMRRIRAEMLPYHIGYWRCATFNPPKDWNGLEQQLAGWDRTADGGIVIDLRDFSASNDYAGAARIASYFTVPGTTLFSVQGLQIPQQVYRNERTAVVFQQPIAVLINRGTIGAAEALASVLKLQARAILVGRSSAGQAALFSEHRLQSGRYLRLASAQAVLGNGTKLFGSAVEPDIALYVDDMREKNWLWKIEQEGAAAAITELPRRKRLNEAALVREENPEIDSAFREQEDEKLEAGKQALPPDAALVRALDVLRAIQLSKNTGSGAGVVN